MCLAPKPPFKENPQSLPCAGQPHTAQHTALTESLATGELEFIFQNSSLLQKKKKKNPQKINTLKNSNTNKIRQLKIDSLLPSYFLVFCLKTQIFALSANNLFMPLPSLNYKHSGAKANTLVQYFKTKQNNNKKHFTDIYLHIYNC